MSYRLEKNKRIAIISQQEFADAIAVIYAPLKDYVSKIIPLMLEHAWQQKKAKNTFAFEELLYSGWICRLITLDNRVLKIEQQNEIQGWPEVREYLIKCLDECKNETQLSAMTDNCMKYIQPILETRFVENYRFPKRMFHCWWYTVHDDHTHLALHLINAYQPDSPFDQLKHFLTTMLQAVEQTIAVYPNIKIVSCGSWLNQLPKFQQLWPESFKRNQKVLNETGGFGPGAWGQYMTTSGGFSEAKAAILRKTGKHPFALTEAQSPVGEVVLHLKKLISEIANK
ncbi:MAG TPA: hypothetical protein VJ279_02600 [Hanamia sp.]|nr:hypothetical protein [Hanamia sp.]